MSRTVLLVVDIQNAVYKNGLYCFEKFTDNVQTLLREARKNRVEVIYVRHDDGEGAELSRGNYGFDICEEFAPLSDEKIFDKTVNSPFRDSGLLEYLLSRKVGRLIVSGLQTEYCIDATVKCGFEHGFEVIVPELCNSTFDNDFMTGEQSYKYYNEFIWKNRYASCVSMDEAVRMIQES